MGLRQRLQWEVEPLDAQQGLYGPAFIHGPAAFSHIGERDLLQSGCHTGRAGRFLVLVIFLESWSTQKPDRYIRSLVQYRWKFSQSDIGQRAIVKLLEQFVNACLLPVENGTLNYLERRILTWHLAEPGYGRRGTIDSDIAHGVSPTPSVRCGRDSCLVLSSGRRPPSMWPNRISPLEYW
ncbi:hypothetical protein N8D56_09215 [Devosia sp. A8/3-2]|nr:hypothetical protein N8D56_09215 [Devosia sp. A8/3-2]